MTFFSLRVRSSTTTIADSSSLPLHTENHTSSPCLLYSGCTMRFGPWPSLRPLGDRQHLVAGASRLSMSNTATDWLIFASGFSGVSTHRFFDFGWVFTNSEPPPWPFSTRTTFQACCGCFSGSVPISVILSLPSALVAQTGPNSWWRKFAPRPGCGIFVDVDHGRQLAVLRVDHRDLVGLVGGRQEVALGESQPPSCRNRAAPMVVTSRLSMSLVVHQQDLARLLDVDDELRVLVRGDDRRHARLGVVFLGVDGHAARRDDLLRLQRRAVHDHELRRPVGAGDGVLVLVALVLRGLHRARLEAHVDLGDCRGTFIHRSIRSILPSRPMV